MNTMAKLLENTLNHAIPMQCIKKHLHGLEPNTVLTNISVSSMPLMLLFFVLHALMVVL